MQKLNEILDAALKFNGPDFYKNQVPEYIYSNLKNGFGQRPYQQEAFGRFVFFWNDYHDRPKGVPTQLLYHMATGSGKTLIMAGLIIYLYERGYRNFLFFVNSANIIDKTRDNFFNTNSLKYLFSDTISIGDKRIKIKEVDNFQATNQEDINIVFSTIQGLHSRLNTPKENSLTYDDFEDTKIVLISDEAHHINAETKKSSELGTEEKEEIISWEGTVNRIFNANKNNILLEFTATADLSVPQIEKKYAEKLILDYPLKQFRIDGYSKEVKVLQADLSQFDRALQGVLLSQYRRKIFEKFKKLIKPVILFKSKTIKESQSFFGEFATGIKNLKVSNLQKIKSANPDEAIANVFKYLEENNISLENLITELQEDFSEEKLISVNSKDESEQKQLAINSLEDEKNEYRAVFAVDKLNEGWDVLNLFDIVRLYDTRDAKKGQPGKTTMAEAQLIGRGARYCPFQISEEQPFYGRKYDDDVTNELRVCEELYYHSAYNPRYIQELNTALEEIGIKAKQSIERPMKLKSDFKQTSFYKAGFIFLNEQQKYNREDVFSLKSTIIEQTHKVSLKTGYTKSSVAFGKTESASVDRKEKEYKLSDFGEHIIRKAINKLEFYQFSNLKELLPNLNSISEFIISADYLGKIKLDVSGLPEQISNLSPKEKLEASVRVLEDISSALASDKIEYQGSKEFKPYMIKDRFKDKVLNFAVNESEDKEYGKSMLNPTETSYHLDLSKRDWYVFEDCFGTSEEKLLIKFIDKAYEKLKLKFEEVYLVRNERHFKIYNFEDGRPIEPDFVLFLVNHYPEESLHYQIFIEPKGGHLIKKDEWKENFLKQLRAEHSLQQLWKGKNYIIWGMPFFNETLRKSEFDLSLNEIIKD
jgi:type III restriction enzyme